MKEKWLFLDIDGVLHPTSSSSSADYLSNMQYLVSALDGHRCQVVISSSWRFVRSNNALKELFPSKVSACIVGVTGEPHIGSMARYNEIMNYLKTIGKPLANWRALDDAYYEFPSGCENLIRCNPNRGMGKPEVDYLRLWLEGSH